MTVQRIKWVDYQSVKNTRFEIGLIEEMNYSGEWEFSHYEVKLNGKVLREYQGYPTDKDLKKLIK